MIRAESFFFGFMVQHDLVDGDGSVFRISVHTAHTVVTDFIRIQIAAVTLAAADTFPVIQHTGTMNSQNGSPPTGIYYTLYSKERSRNH